MTTRPLTIEGAYEITPVQHGDPRGLFVEWYRTDELVAEIGHPLHLAQANLSVSARGVVRGIHFADVPPGQAKYVTCARGAVLDVVVDIRVGSPTFGQWDGGPPRRRGPPGGLPRPRGSGHGFCALTDDATLTYLCSTTYNPAAEHTVHPLDPELAIDWPCRARRCPPATRRRPRWPRPAAGGLLPDYASCVDLHRIVA